MYQVVLNCQEAHHQKWSPKRKKCQTLPNFRIQFSASISLCTIVCNKSFFAMESNVTNVVNLNEIVSFNVGGNIFSTTTETLKNIEPDNLFYKIYLGDVNGSFKALKDSAGNFFIDRDSSNIAELLNYLRTGDVPKSFSEELLKDVSYYNFTNLAAIYGAGEKEPRAGKRKRNKFDCFIASDLENVFETKFLEILVFVKLGCDLLSNTQNNVEFENIQSYCNLGNIR
jgi:hypothetical protein